MIRKYVNTNFSKLATLKDENAANGYGAGLMTEMIHESIASNIIQLIGSDENNTLLDVGCGTGELLYYLKSHYGCVKGIDSSSEMVARATAKGLHVVHSLASELPYDDNSFDRVIVYFVLINIPSKRVAQKIICEALRVTKPGGIVLIGAIPIYGLSGLPCHDIVTISRHAIAKILGREPLTCFSYPWSFFSKIGEQQRCNQLEFHMSTIDLFKKTHKYDVLIRK